MKSTDPRQLAAAAFENHFGRRPETTAFAPGRVNLLGEHTDYNGGFVLPMALEELGVGIAVARGDAPGKVELFSSTFDAARTRTIDEDRAGDWSDYVLGCLKSACAEDVAAGGIRVALATTLPMGAGLSSSAALEVATLKAAAQLFGRKTDPVSVAVEAQAVENGFVGMPCGIMDQFASSVGTPGMALFLNTRTLEYAPAPSIPGYRFVIVGSGVSHQLTEDGYATRVAECRQACKLLEVAMLSDLEADALGGKPGLPELLHRRVRHIVTENQRVHDGLEALRAADAGVFGRLMLESHISQKDDYEITVAETDAIVETAIALGACGARQTGGGFGGSVLALVADGDLEAWADKLTATLPHTTMIAIV
ncbi:UNVERIFIED_ORG: galactokinase [Martelella mediterranea]